MHSYRAAGSMFLVVVVAGLALAAASCGGGGSEPPPGFSPQTSFGTAMVFAQDAPADNIVKFEITLTGVVFNPGNVSVLASPVELELTQLEASPQLVRLNSSIPAASYSSVVLTFANPEIKFVDTDGTACGLNQVCEVEPPLTNSSVTANVSFTIAEGQTTGLLIDFNLANSIVTNASGTITGVNPMVTVSVLNVTGVTGEFEEEVGRVVSINSGNSTFVFEVFSSCPTQVTIQTNAGTEFEDFDEAGLPNSFAGLAVNQIVEVEADLQANGTLLAEEVEMEDEINEDELEGIIVAVTRNGSDQVTQFQMVMLDVAPCTATVPASDLITVNVPTDGSVDFRIDTDGFSVNNSLFDDPTDLEVGQKVDVDPVGALATTITAEEIKLEDQTVRGTVISTAGDNFGLNPNSDLFPDQSITVQTVSGQTEFDDLPAGVGSLSGGQLVRVKGVLFRTGAGEMTLLAKKVDGTP